MSQRKRKRTKVSWNRIQKRLRRIVLIVAMLFVGLLGNVASAEPPTEHDVKVAYLYHFTKFVSWPEGAMPAGQDAFVIGVLGQNPFGPSLDKLAARKLAQKRRIVVRYFDTLADYKPCQILFVSGMATPELHAAIIRQTRSQPVLVVGESAGYSESGATANFVLTEDGAIKIEINIDAMNRRRMQANALLLKLATVVRDRGAE